jgi:hypothetical protein
MQEDSRWDIQRYSKKMKGDSEEMLEIGNGICRKIQAGRYKEIYEIYKERFREIRGRYMTIWRRYKEIWADTRKSGKKITGTNWIYWEKRGQYINIPKDALTFMEETKRSGSDENLIWEKHSNILAKSRKIWDGRWRRIRDERYRGIQKRRRENRRRCWRSGIEYVARFGLVDAEKSMKDTKSDSGRLGRRTWQSGEDTRRSGKKITGTNWENQGQYTKIPRDALTFMEETRISGRDAK